MTQTAAIWLVLVLAFCAANLPFLSQRLFGLVLEQRAGQIAPQGWEFYAISGALFLTFAFPGFVWRYLYKPRN